MSRPMLYGMYLGQITSLRKLIPTVATTLERLFGLSLLSRNAWPVIGLSLTSNIDHIPATEYILGYSSPTGAVSAGPACQHGFRPRGMRSSVLGFPVWVHQSLTVEILTRPVFAERGEFRNHLD